MTRAAKNLEDRDGLNKKSLGKYFVTRKSFQREKYPADKIPGKYLVGCPLQPPTATWSSTTT